VNSQQYALFEQGLEAFEAGQYFEAHEFWEDLWQPMPSDDPLKPWLQGLIQLAVGLHHWQRGNAHGARSLLNKAERNLSSPPPNLPKLCPESLLVQVRQLQHLLRFSGEGSSNILPKLPSCRLCTL
jgi:predicted metal-dependent hydrolase